VPFHRTWTPGAKFAPKTCRVKQDGLGSPQEIMPACMFIGKIALTEATVRLMGRVCETAPVVGSVTNRDTG